MSEIEPHDEESSEEVWAGIGSVASESPGYQDATAGRFSYVARNSSNPEECSIDEDQEVGVAAQGELSPALEKDVPSCNEAVDGICAENQEAADVSTTLANPAHGFTPPSSGGQDLARSNHGAVDDGELNETTISVAAKQPFKSEQSLNSHDASRLDPVSLGTEPSEKASKKQRQYARKCRQQIDRWVEIFNTMEQNVHNCLTKFYALSVAMEIDGASKAFSGCSEYGYLQLRQATAATGHRARISHQQTTALKTGLLHLFPSCPWDEWGRAVKALGENELIVTRDLVDSKLLDKPSEAVASVFVTKPLLLHYLRSISSVAKALQARTELQYQFAEFCERKKGLPGVFDVVGPSSVMEADGSGVIKGSMERLMWLFNESVQYIEIVAGAPKGRAK